MTQQITEREHKTRAKRISFAIHLILLLLLLIPIIRPDLEQKDFERAITIDFSEPITDTGSSKKSGSGKEAAASPAAARQKVEVSQIEAKPVQSQPQMAIPERKEVITMPTPELPVPKVQETNAQEWNDVVEEVEISEEVPEPLPEPVKEPVKETEAVPEVAEEADVAPSWTEGWADFGKAQSDAQTTGSGDGQQGDQAGAGKGDGTNGQGTGTGNAGKDTGKGNQGMGNFLGDFPGDGRLTRKVIKYADATSLAGISGKAVLNLCVDRPGKVRFVEYDFSKSTILDPDIIRKIQDLLRAYEFEQDYSAPARQCGSYTWNYSVETKKTGQ